MCTLAVWIDAFEGLPLVVAANRDERLGRVSRGPRLWDGPVRFIAPRDEVQGGTWWALNERGLFVGITNRFGVPNDPARRSRGLLVADVARAHDLAEAKAIARSLDPRAYNGFHLLVTDGARGLRVIGDGDTISRAELGRGRHVVSERSFDAATTSRDAAVFAAFDRAEALGRPPGIESLAAALATHGETALDSVCVHLPEYDYGTRSATILARSLTSVQLRFAPGPPCTTPFENLDALARQFA